MSVFTLVYLRLRKHRSRYLGIHYALGLLGYLYCIGALLVSLETALVLGGGLILSVAVINILTAYAMIKAGRRRAREYTAAFGIMLIIYLAVGSSILGFFESVADAQVFIHLALVLPVLLFGYRQQYEPD
jgi:predicted tellurium resistance membrane protein TerC